MKHYTVILLLPDYATDNFGRDTYCDHVTSIGPASAIEVARRNCMEANDGGTIDEPEDLFVIAVFSGHHDDLACEVAP
jgi:hypothetical protein